MVHAGVIQIVVECNDFKTKLAKCRDPAIRDRALLVEATASNRSGGPNIATTRGCVRACRAADGRAFDELQRCPDLSHF